MRCGVARPWRHRPRVHARTRSRRPASLRVWRARTVSRCRGRADEYEYANVPGGQWRTKRQAAEQLCAGCPLLSWCAQLALKQHALGMVYAGVPIPPEHNDRNLTRARELLIEVARYGRQQ
ncbi:WhiB family transcriptional regulator [Rhodococcoides fascians]|uniref:WhiB family transcriptional regulator n=1 Tax=Rhodococcoides fascians TaxID=1828 RepID=UPI0035305221